MYQHTHNIQQCNRLIPDLRLTSLDITISSDYQCICLFRFSSGACTLSKYCFVSTWYTVLMHFCSSFLVGMSFAVDTCHMGHFVLDPVTANANAEWGPLIPTTQQTTPHNIKRIDTRIYFNKGDRKSQTWQSRSAVKSEINSPLSQPSNTMYLHARA